MHMQPCECFGLQPLDWHHIRKDFQIIILYWAPPPMYLPFVYLMSLNMTMQISLAFLTDWWVGKARPNMGSPGGKPHRENVCYLDALRLILVHSEPISTALYWEWFCDIVTQMSFFKQRWRVNILLSWLLRDDCHYIAAMPQQLAHAVLSQWGFLRWVLLSYCTTKSGVHWYQAPLWCASMVASLLAIDRPTA